MVENEVSANPGEHGEPADGGSAPVPWWRHWWVRVAAAAVLVVGGVVIWSIQRDDAGEGSASSTVSMDGRPSTTGRPPTSDEPTTVTSSPRGPSAADDLVGFFDAVEVTDRDLAAAADAVNGSIGPDTVTFEQSTIDAIDRAEPTAVAASIPPGLEPAVEQAVLLVYSDLMSRFASLQQGYCMYVGTRPRSMLDPSCFSQGHAAAARTPADVERARAVAEDAPPAVAPAPDSREAVEVRLRIGFIDLANRGCDSGGGFLATEPILVQWYDSPVGDPATPDIPPIDGEVGWEVSPRVQFRATYAPASGWAVSYNAC